VTCVRTKRWCWQVPTFRFFVFLVRFQYILVFVIPTSVLVSIIHISQYQFSTGFTDPALTYHVKPALLHDKQRYICSENIPYCIFCFRKSAWRKFLAREFHNNCYLFQFDTIISSKETNRFCQSELHVKRAEQLSLCHHHSSRQQHQQHFHESTDQADLLSKHVLLSCS